MNVRKSQELKGHQPGQAGDVDHRLLSPWNSENIQSRQQIPHLLSWDSGHLPLHMSRLHPTFPGGAEDPAEEKHRGAELVKAGMGNS